MGFSNARLFNHPIYDIHLLNSTSSDMGSMGTCRINGIQWLFKALICIWHDDSFIPNIRGAAILAKSISC